MPCSGSAQLRSALLSRPSDPPSTPHGQAPTVQVFYTTTARASEVKGHWCHACYSEARDGLTQMDGSTVRKTDLNKRKNDEEVSATCCLGPASPVWLHLVWLQQSGCQSSLPWHGPACAGTLVLIGECRQLVSVACADGGGVGAVRQLRGLGPPDLRPLQQGAERRGHALPGLPPQFLPV